MKKESCDTIVIYGCGINGIHLYYRLKEQFDVLCFADRDAEKQGYVIDGIQCISYEELMRVDRDVKVFVSLEKPYDVVNELIEVGFEHAEAVNHADFDYAQYSISIEELKKMKSNLETGLNKKDADVLMRDEITAPIIRDYWIRKNECC